MGRYYSLSTSPPLPSPPLPYSAMRPWFANGDGLDRAASAGLIALTPTLRRRRLTKRSWGRSEREVIGQIVAHEFRDQHRRHSNRVGTLDVGRLCVPHEKDLGRREIEPLANQVEDCRVRFGQADFIGKNQSIRRSRQGRNQRLAVRHCKIGANANFDPLSFQPLPDFADAVAQLNRGNFRL